MYRVYVKPGHISLSKDVLSPIGREGMQWACFVLKRQNCYELFVILKIVTINKNSQECNTG